MVEYCFCFFGSFFLLFFSSLFCILLSSHTHTKKIKKFHLISFEQQSFLWHNFYGIIFVIFVVVVKYGIEDKKNKWNHSQWTNVESTAVICCCMLWQKKICMTNQFKHLVCEFLERTVWFCSLIYIFFYFWWEKHLEKLSIFDLNYGFVIFIIVFMFFIRNSNNFLCSCVHLQQPTKRQHNYFSLKM